MVTMKDNAAAIALYLLLDQNAALYRRVAAHDTGRSGALRALARGLAIEGIKPHHRQRAADWPDGPLAAVLHAQWQLALNWLGMPGRGLWHDHPACQDDGWPLGLSQLEERPPLLFWAGDEQVFGLPQIALVGSRAASRHGLALARQFSTDLVRGGFAITSGLASGIDAAAHEGALQAGGVTVAVMGCGLDRIYPPRHATLAQRIVESKGLLVSEFVPGTPPLKHHFPRRNLVISALSLGVLVVEAGPDSGSIITARAANGMSRDVWAVPGPVHSLQSRGCHQLIRHEQAHLVETAADVAGDALSRLREWVGQSAGPVRAAPVADVRVLPGAAAQALRDRMDWQVYSLDELVDTGSEPPATVMACLGELEVMGWVAAVPGGYQRLPA